MNMTEAPSDKHLDIRKYPNRRYYDATHSRHLTLEQIRSLIRDGYDIKVTDSKTGADITAQVLTQIILEFEPPKLDNFPASLLLRLIRTNDQVVREFVETYFNQAFKSYLEYQKQMEDRLRQMQGFAGLFPPFGAWAQSATSPFGAPSTSKSSSPQESPSPAPSPPSAADSKDLRNTIMQLQQELASLRAEMRRTKRKKQGSRYKKGT